MNVKYQSQRYVLIRGQFKYKTKQKKDKKNEGYVHRTWMPQLSVKVNKALNSRTEKVIKSKIELGLPFMVPDILYKIQMICLRQMQEVHTDMGQIIQKNNTPRCLAVEV